MTRSRWIVMAALVLGTTALHAATDPFLGNWALDTKRSKYVGTACPKMMTIEMTAAEKGVHYHSVTQLANGTSFSADYTAQYDGNPAMVSGAKGVLLPVTLRREGPGTVTATYTSGLETRATSRRVVSADGSTMTVTTTSRDGSGNSFTNVGVYRRTGAAAGGSFDLSKTRDEIKLKP